MDAQISDQTKLLFEYTKFHIGLYASLMSALIAFMKFGHDRNVVSPSLLRWLKLTLVCFVLAGAAGGIIGSSVSLDFASVASGKRLGPLCLPILSAPMWAHVEHLAFWAGIGVAVGAVLFESPSGQNKASR